MAQQAKASAVMHHILEAVGEQPGQMRAMSVPCVSLVHGESERSMHECDRHSHFQQCSPPWRQTR
jgi:hypothetical protein